MQTLEFPHCCTAKLIVDFGESSIAEGGNGLYSLEQIEEYLEKQLHSWYNKSLALFTVITNNEQKVANKALRNLGFNHSKWISKEIHPETKVRLWWKEPSFLKEI